MEENQKPAPEVPAKEDHVKEFLTGYHPVRATVSKDFQSTFTVYESIFKRSKA